MLASRQPAPGSGAALTRRHGVRWPESREIHRAVGEKLTSLLDRQGGLVAEIGQATLAEDRGILGPKPHSVISVLVVGACIAAGGRWRAATWPAAAAECALAAADLLDDVADGEIPARQVAYSGGVILTAAAGLLALAHEAVLCTAEDGLSPERVTRMGRVFAAEFARAAEGQARSLHGPRVAGDVAAALDLAACKSGPLGSLAARVGARCATDDQEVEQLLGVFGSHLAVANQLTNDARDASPEGSPTKRDVREGRPTVPLVFAQSSGAPLALSADSLEAWEIRERSRVVRSGGVATALALAEAQRLYAAQALDELASRGSPVEGLRRLLT